MLRTALVAVALSLAACGGEEEMESNFPDPSGLYRIEADGPVCDGGAVTLDEPDTVVCRYECLHMDGRDVRSVNLTFRREGDAWRQTFAGWNFGLCE